KGGGSSGTSPRSIASTRAASSGVIGGALGTCPRPGTDCFPPAVGCIDFAADEAGTVLPAPGAAAIDTPATDSTTSASCIFILTTTTLFWPQRRKAGDRAPSRRQRAPATGPPGGTTQ